ncbi:MAG: hypothetical protein R2708_17320 [Vicinamibacterales bacterium]
MTTFNAAVAATLTGRPAICLPSGFSPDGLPYSLQVRRPPPQRTGAPAASRMRMRTGLQLAYATPAMDSQSG